MNIEELCDYCASFPGVEACTPFDEDTLVYKVCGKMFVYFGMESYERGVSMKCDPEYAIELRERYPDDIFPGFHSSKVHWNTVLPEGNVPEKMLCELIRHSYDCVVAKLPRKEREILLKNATNLN